MKRHNGQIITGSYTDYTASRPYPGDLCGIHEEGAGAGTTATHVFIVDNRGSTPRIIKTEIKKITEKAVTIDQHEDAFGYRSQLKPGTVHFNELDAIREFIRSRRQDESKLVGRLARCRQDINVMLKLKTVSATGCKGQAVRVESYNLDTGETIKQYASVNQAARGGNVKSSISDCINGKAKSHHGQGWRTY